MPRITVFTPTFNRAHLIHRVFESLRKQTFDDFEWIVIDDGSTDNTVEVLDGFKTLADFHFTVISRDNRGKAASINQSLDIARGELFIVLDDDDWCRADAFEEILRAWDSVPEQQRLGYSGVSCLKCFVDGSLVGENYDRMPGGGLSYVDRYDRRIRGDKWEIIRTDVHRSFRYDIAEGERHMAESYAWLGIGTRYKTVFLNIALCIVEYQSDGLTANSIRQRKSSPISAGRYYDRALHVSRSIRGRTRAAINQVRFYLHGHGRGPLSIGHPLVLASLVPGTLLFLADCGRGR